MDERLKLLMQELGSAINDSLADSDRIASAIGDIRKAGFDVFSHHKSVVRKPTFPDPAILYPPYTGWKEKLVRRVFR